MAMQPHSSFDALSRVIERLGTDGRTVRRVEAAASADERDSGSLRATVDVVIPFCEAVSSGAASSLEATAASVDDGELNLTVQLPVFPDASTDAAEALPDGTRVSANSTDARFEGGHVLVSLDVVIEADSSSDTRSAGRSAAADADTPEPGPTASAVTDGAGMPSGALDASAGTDDAERPESEMPSAFGETATESAVDDTETDTSTAATADSVDDSDDASSLAAARDDSVPPYEDTPYLRRLYESCDTFEEMSQRIEMDVSDETVRRYMIEAGVHSPTSYETGAAAAESVDSEEPADRSPSAESDISAGPSTADGGDERVEDDARADPLPDDQLVADGIGFPDRLTLHDVVDAVVDARTVHEVGRELGLEHDRTRQLLRQLNVLDLVLRRVSDDPKRETSVEDVAARIRQCAPDGT